jgi:hypothetical protein
MTGQKKNVQAQDHRDQPVYWFVVLEQARERSDFESAANAKQELERLGVRVSYRRREALAR